MPRIYPLLALCFLGLPSFAHADSVWVNPNVPGRIPLLQPAHYPKWTDAGATLTPGTPASCDPATFLTHFASGDALDGFFKSSENASGARSVLKDFFNGHPLGFATGKILFPVGVGRVRSYQGDGARRLRDVFEYERGRVSTSSSADDAAYQYCATYFNEGNKDAQKDFQWLFIPADLKGKTTDPAKVVKATEEFNTSFTQMMPRLLACEQNFGYFAFGCQSAFERTPTLLAMVLKEAGCSTDNSVFIADMLLGQNDIPLETRKQIVDQTPIDAGTQAKLQAAFFAP